MPTLLLRLAGPMQSWGTASRFDHRDTGKEPSKSGVLGLLAAALGIARENWVDLEPLTRLGMGVRHDRAGEPMRDYQTAKDIIKSGGKGRVETAVTPRDYIADAVFLVGLEGQDKALLERAQVALRDPCWPLGLGRKSYVPSEPIWLEDGLQAAPLREVLLAWPWLAVPRKWEPLPDRLILSLESEDQSGLLKMDQPLSAFAERRFGARDVRSDWIPFPGVVSHASA